MSFEVFIVVISMAIIMAITIVYCCCYKPTIRYTEIEEGGDEREKEQFVEKTHNDMIPIDLSKSKDGNTSNRINNVKNYKDTLSTISDPEEQL